MVKRLNYKKIKAISAKKKYGHIKISTPVPIQRVDISPENWNQVKKEALKASLSKRGKSKKAFLDFNELLFEKPSVVESHVVHAEVLNHIQILDDPKRVVKVDPEKYLYTHASIISSVNVEEDDHTICEHSTKDVNKNGDAWETKLLLATYKSFIGAYNYLEHVQIPSMKKGWIIDAVPRYSKNKDGKKFAIIDILVATEREHKSLISALESGELNTLSMGCSAKFTICSQCGYVSANDYDSCSHIPNKKLESYTHSDGSKRVIAELCGHHTDPESVVFEEASWVYDPAFVIAEAKKRVASVKGTPEVIKDLEKWKKGLLKRK